MQRHRMSYIILSGLFFLAALATPLRADTETIQPVAVLQIQPLEELRASVVTLARNFLPGPMFKEMESALAGPLDLKQLKGVDGKKPIGIYATIGEGLLGGNLSGTAVVALVPVTEEKAFLELLEMVGMQVEKKDEGYQLSLPGIPVPGSLSFPKGYARLIVAMAKTDEKTLPALEDIFRDRGTALASLRLWIERVPENVRNLFLENFTKTMKPQIQQYDRIIANLKKQGTIQDDPQESQLIRLESARATTLVGLYWMELLVKSSRELAIRVDLDPKTGVLGKELTLLPRAGSDLAKSLADLKATQNSLTQIAGADSTLQLLLQIPFPTKEFRDWMVRDTRQREELLKKQMKANQMGDEEWIRLVRAAYQAAEDTIQDGKIDLAVSLRGSDKSKQSTAIAAFSLKDTSGIDKALRPALKKIPREEAQRFQPDTFQVEQIAVHAITINDLIPPDVKKIFGTGPVMVALAPMAVIVTYGPDARNVMKEVLLAKQSLKTVPLIQADVSGKKVLKLFQDLEAPPEALQFIEKMTTPERSPLLAVKIEGGEKLLFRIELGLPALWVIAPKAAKQQ